MAALSDFDLALSRIALKEGAPVGIGVVAVRGAEGWIGGLGVVASERRRGVGRMLMDATLDAARAAGIRGVSLEVLEGNAAAVALYEQLGFERTRMLEVWSLASDVDVANVEPDSVSNAAEWIRANRRAPEPWQRADRSVENLARGGTSVEAVSVPGRGAALFRVSDEVASVLQLAARDDDTAAELLAAVRRRGRSLRFVNVPEGDPASDALRKLGGDLEVRQLELALALDT
jgi:predicted N-acetyltransferase YhbS